MNQGDLWLLETPDSKARPVLVLTRNEAIPVLRTVVVAPVTSTVRSIPTCIPLGPADGVDRECVATFDNLTSVPKSMLVRRLGSLSAARRHELCAALSAFADC